MVAAPNDLDTYIMVAAPNDLETYLIVAAPNDLDTYLMVAAPNDLDTYLMVAAPNDLDTYLMVAAPNDLETYLMVAAPNDLETYLMVYKIEYYRCKICILIVFMRSLVFMLPHLFYDMEMYGSDILPREVKTPPPPQLRYDTQPPICSVF